MVWINKDTGVVLSKDGHTLFVDLVAEDEERERLAERSGLADPHGDMPDKEYLEAAVIIHDNGHAHGECYATDRHTGMVRFGRFELTDMELNQLGRELPFLADREDPRKGQERLGRFFGGSPYVRHSERYVGGGRHEANPDIRAGIADYLDAALAEYRESGYSAYEGGMSMTGYQTRDLSDIKAFISYIASSPDCPATTTLRSWAEYEDLSDHAGFSRTCSTRPAEGWTGSACPGRNAERAWTRMPWASKGPPGDGRTCWPFPRRTAWIPRWPRISPFWPGFLSSAAYAGDGRLRGRSGPTVCADPDSTAMFPKRGEDAMADRTRLVDRLRYERDARIDHALFYWTQVFMAYNSNHMEGSTLTPEQTRQIYDTGRLLADADEQIRLDDAIETRNHFTAFNYVIDHADDPVDAGYVCRLHALLKRGTSQDGDPGFNVGGYKTRDNAIVQRMGVAMVRTVPAGDVPGMMERVYAAYAGLSDDPVRIAMCHWMFERVHPFSDGNGRVGRLVMFKECLRLDTVPPLVRDENRNMYVRGLDEFPGQPGWLVDTLLAERDSYLSSFIETLAPGAVRCSYADEWSEGASSGVLAEAADFERDVESLAASGDGPDGDEDPFASYYGGARPTTRGGR